MHKQLWRLQQGITQRQLKWHQQNPNRPLNGNLNVAFDRRNV
jgi:hypothetical protein